MRQCAGAVAMGGALGRAEAECGHAVAHARRGRCFTDRCAVGLAGHQQDLALRGAALTQQPRGLLDRPVRPLAVGGHDVGRQRIEVQRQVGGVLGQRCDREGVIGEDQQGRLARAAGREQSGELGARLQQPRGRQVAGVRRGGQLERDHQRRRRRALQRRRQLAPARSGQGEHRAQRGEHPASEPQQSTTIDPTFDQMRQQMRIDRAAPDIRIATSRPPAPGQHRQHEQRPQPQRPREMESVQQRDHGAAS